MKTYIFHSLVALLTVFAIAASGPAQSADLFDDAAPYQASNEEAFHGLGVGVHAGGGFTSIDVGSVFDGVSADGVLAGAHAEYLLASGNFRIGPWIDGEWTNINTSLSGLGDVLKKDWSAGGGLKAGFVVNGSTLISAHGGYRLAEWSSDIFSGDIDVRSWVIGGCAETMVAHNASLGLCGDYSIIDNAEAGGTSVTSFVEDSEELAVKARLTWRQ